MEHVVLLKVVYHNENNIEAITEKFMSSPMSSKPVNGRSHERGGSSWMSQGMAIKVLSTRTKASGVQILLPSAKKRERSYNKFSKTKNLGYADDFFKSTKLKWSGKLLQDCSRAFVDSDDSFETDDADLGEEPKLSQAPGEEQKLRQAPPGEEQKSRQAPGEEQKSRQAPGEEQKLRQTPGEEKMLRQAPGEEQKSRQAPVEEKMLRQAPGEEQKLRQAPHEEQKSRQAPGEDDKLGQVPLSSELHGTRPRKPRERSPSPR